MEDVADHDSGEQRGASQEERRDYLDNMIRRRGYVLDYHKYLAAADFEVLVAADSLVRATYLRPRTLSPATKELLFILSLTVMRASRAQISSHIRVGLGLRLSAMDILEAIEISLPEAGIVAFQVGFDAWIEAVGANALEPSEGSPQG